MATTFWFSGPSRRSERGVKLRTVYSPEPHIKPKTKKLKAKEKRSRYLQPIAGSQIGQKNANPTFCEKCKVLIVISSQRKAKRKAAFSSNSEQGLDSAKVAILCHTCSSSQLKKPKKQKILPSNEEKEKYQKEAQGFAHSLVEVLRDQDAERLFCPEFKLQPCACLQKFILADGNIEESHSRGQHLLLLLKEAKRLSQQKCYNLQDVQASNTKGRRAGCIGMGNGHKRSEQFEKFVLQQREYLRKDLRLCERATQKVLVYSNNFLHKKLKTEPQKLRRVERSKGKAALGLLTSVADLPNQTCCSDNCVMMASTHGKLLEQWRERAAMGQAEARRVIAEMLTPSGGGITNCFKFISLVTGCSNCTIAKVNEQMYLTGGDREPPEHGLRKWWQEQAKKQQSSAQRLQISEENTGALLNSLAVQPDSILSPESSELQCSLSSSLEGKAVSMDDVNPPLTNHQINIQNQCVASTSVLPMITECTVPEKPLESCVMFPIVNQMGHSVPILGESTASSELASLSDQQLVLEEPSGERLGTQLLSLNIGNILLIQPPSKHPDPDLSRTSKENPGPSGLTFSGLFTPGPQLGSNLITTVPNPATTNGGASSKNVHSIVLTLNLPKPKDLVQETASLECTNSQNSLLSSTDCTLLRTPL